MVRNITDPALANIAVPLPNPGLLHRVVDPDAGDTLLVVTAAPPIRGFIKRQDFVDFAVLDSAHGVAIRPNSDDVAVEIAGTKVIIGKPGGLTLSSVDVAAERAPSAVRPMFDVEEWNKNRCRARCSSSATMTLDQGRRHRCGRARTCARRPGSRSHASTWRARCITRPRASPI